jgi:hypothetical protein
MSVPGDNQHKTPPFVFDNDVNRATNEPASRSRPLPNNHQQQSGYPSNRGMLSVVIFLISALSMGIGLAAGAWVGFRILQNGISDIPAGELFAGIAAAGLAYGVGWIVGLFGIRMLANFILPYAMAAYAWVTLIGLSVLQIAIISKLFNQAYNTEKFIFYVILFGAGIVALIGIHLLIEDHNLMPFSLPILIISLCHLYLIVFHYVFMPSENVTSYGYLWGDTVFFLVTAIVGVLMLAHLGVLSGFRSNIDRAFENTKPLVPPS